MPTYLNPHDWLNEVCGKLGAVVDAVEFREADGTGTQTWVAVARASWQGRTYMFESQQTGWKGAAARAAVVGLIRQIDGAALIPAEWESSRDILPFAAEQLEAACKARGILPPKYIAQRIDGVFTRKVEFEIRALNQWFTGVGGSNGEACAVAATEALRVLAEFPPGPLTRVETAEVEDESGESEGSYRRLPSSARLGPGRRPQTGEPLGWLLELCEMRGWPAPEFVTQSFTKSTYLTHVSKVTLRIGRVTHACVGNEATVSRGSDRHACLLMIRLLAPEIDLAPDWFDRVTSVEGMISCNRDGPSLGWGKPVVTFEKSQEDAISFVASLYFDKRRDRVWRRHGFSKQEAKALAAADAANEIAVEIKAREMKPRVIATAARSPAPETRAHDRTPWRVSLGQKLSQAVPFIGAGISVSPSKTDAAEWTLKLPNRTALRLGADTPNQIKLIGAVDRNGVEIAIPHRLRRAVATDLHFGELAAGIKTAFVDEVRALEPQTSKRDAGDVEQRLILTANAQPVRPEVEADPFVKGASKYFRDGFIAYCDGLPEDAPWANDLVRGIEWKLGIEYAQLCCAQCGAKNTEGARCEMPAVEEETPRSLVERFQDAIPRFLEGMNREQRLAESSLLDEVLSHLQATIIRDAELDAPKTYCIRCKRQSEPARGVLCLNPGFALAQLEQISAEDGNAPYRSVAVYGLRRRPKAPDFWAYVVVTNGTIAECRDPEISVYRQAAELVDATALKAATLTGGRPRL